VLIVELFVHGIYVYLFEVERRPESDEAYAMLALAKADGGRASVSLLTEVLDWCANVQGRWKREKWVRKDLRRIVVKHAKRPTGSDERGQEAQERYAALLANQLDKTVLELSRVVKG
jgi:hypothetical protein